MKIEEKLDCGPVLSSKEIELNKNSTFGEIEKKLSIEGADLLFKTLKNLRNKKIKFKKQDDSKATYAKKIRKDETRINKILPILNFLLKKKTKIIILSHVGRPKGRVNPDLSMRPICENLEKKINEKINLITGDIRKSKDKK